MLFRFEKCTLHHLETLLQIARQTFIEAFASDNNPLDFEKYINTAFTKEQLIRELNNKDTSFYLTYVDEVLVAYIKINENDAQSDIKAEEALELERIYVIADYQGKKIGEWLLNTVRDIAVKQEKTYMWLGVWEENVRAIAFYEAHGFYKFDTHPYYIGTDKQTDWLMRLDV